MTNAGKIWKFRSPSNKESAALARKAGISGLLARLLLQRGITGPEAASAFLYPSLDQLHSPFLFGGMKSAVQRIKQAIKADEQVCIFGDYDVDGMTSTALLVQVLRSLGASVSFYIPSRIDEGYGLNADALHSIAGQGVKLVISVDCGITAVDEAAIATELGLDLIITDHHTPSDRLPEVCAIVHPRVGADGSLSGDAYPFPELAGVGVAFKLGCALLEELAGEAGAFVGDSRDGADPVSREDLLDLVCLGTIADSVPLVGENRALVVAGLEAVKNTRRDGLRSLIKVAGIEAGADLSVRDCSFGLSPRLNAAGRIKSAACCVDLLLTDDAGHADGITEELEQFNRERQGIEEKIRLRAMELVETTVDLEKDRVIILAEEGWHTGVQGIVCSKILERYGRPTILLTIEDGVAKGSGRSQEGFFLHDALARSADLLNRFGGHAYAAGLALPVENLDAFRERMNAIAAEVMTEEDLRGTVMLDGSFDASEVSFDLVADISRLAPFGVGNPEPLFSLRGYIDEIRRVGQQKQHLKFMLTGKAAFLEAIAFHHPSDPKEVGPYEIAAYLERDEWQGRERLQLKVQDIRMGPADDERTAVDSAATVLAATDGGAPSDQVVEALKSHLGGETVHLYTYDREDLVALTAGLHEKDLRVAWVVPDDGAVRLLESWISRCHPLLYDNGSIFSRHSTLGAEDELLAQILRPDSDRRFALMPLGAASRRLQELKAVSQDWSFIFIDCVRTAAELVSEFMKSEIRSLYVTLSGSAPLSANGIPGRIISRSTPQAFRMMDRREKSRGGDCLDDLRAREGGITVFDGLAPPVTNSNGNGGANGGGAAAGDGGTASDGLHPLDGAVMGHLAICAMPASEWEFRQLGLSLWGRQALLHLMYGSEEGERRERELAALAPDRAALAEIYRATRDAGNANPDGNPAAAVSKQFGSMAAATAFRIFEEIGAVTYTDGALQLLPTEGKLDLESSPSYMAGIAERRAFDRFRVVAIRAKIPELERLLRH